MLKSMKYRIAAVTLVGAFAAAGPLQHFGAVPQTVVGDASKASIKWVLDLGTTEAHACMGNGFGNKGGFGNNGFGNGASDGVPGRSGFTDTTR